jgi:phage baseplate assembly protein W
MVKHYYELPIEFESLMQRNKDLPTCDFKKSIAQNIYLIITSKFREHRYDDSYGCEIWNMDFELISNENMWLDRIHKSIVNSLKVHERRLNNVSVEIEIALDEKLATLKNTQTVKRCLSIKITGNLTETGELFPFNTNIYLSPLSLD